MHHSDSSPAGTADGDPASATDNGPAGVAAQAVFRPVRTGNPFEETVERLLSAIRLGVVGHGERFPAERELAARLGVSRVILRDSLRALQEAGYVESRRGRFGGAFVTYVRPKPSRSEAQRVLRDTGTDLDDLFTHRRALETGAAVVLAEKGLTPTRTGCSPSGWRRWRGPRWMTTGAWTRSCT